MTMKATLSIILTIGLLEVTAASVTRELRGTTAEDREQVRILEAKRGNAQADFDAMIGRYNKLILESRQANAVRAIDQQLKDAHKRLAAKCRAGEKLGEDAGRPDEYLRCVKK